MHTLFLDANILFSASMTTGGPNAFIIQLSQLGHCHICSSQYALDEALRNLNHKYPEATEVFDVITQSLKITPEPNPKLVNWAETLLPAKDAPILAAAVTARATILVTGDRKHFSELYGLSFSGLQILTPTQALEELLNG